MIPAKAHALKPILPAVKATLGVLAASAACIAGIWLAGRFAGPVSARDAGAPAFLAAISAVASVLGVSLLLLSLARRAATARLLARLALDGESTFDDADVPRWLAPLARAVRDAGVRSAERIDALTTKLREAEIRLSIAEADRRHCEAILDSLRDAVIVTDSFNELVLANAAAGKLLGCDPEQIAHRPIDEVIRDPSLLRLIKEARQSGVVGRQRHVDHSMPPGTPGSPGIGEESGSASFDVAITCLPNQSRTEVAGVVAILRDVTREKEISRMKSDFVSRASHELRTPIASINAYVEMLLDSEAGDEAARQEFYRVIKAETERITRMIDTMLNISRIEAGIVSVERSEVDFAKVVREVIEVMRPQASAKNIMLIEKIGPLLYTAEADRDMIHQAVLNLVSNAVKYTPEGGRVAVSVENDDATRSVLVSVQDTGLGIPPEALGRIFGKFYRIESYKRMAEGTGLGLNLVKHLIETVHKGQVGVSSQVGMGSRFWFTVPYEFQGG